MNMRGLNRTSLLLILGACALATGCGAAADAVSERTAEAVVESQLGKGVNFDVDDDGTVAIDSTEGRVRMGATDVPDSWPADVPIPEMTDLVATELAVDGESLHSVSGTSPLTVAEIEATYAALDGWTQDARNASTSGGDTSVTLVMSKDDREIVIVVGSTDGTTQLSVSHVQRDER